MLFPTRIFAALIINGGSDIIVLFQESANPKLDPRISCINRPYLHYGEAIATCGQGENNNLIATSKQQISYRLLSHRQKAICNS